MSKPEFEYIDADRTLSDTCLQIADSEVLAVDTEFLRETTYYPIPALIQVCANDRVFLIDPTRIRDFEPLVALFNNPRIVKVMHSCSEDLEVFNRLLKTPPAPLFDTQVAAAMCGYGFSVSYSGLVEELTGNILDKSETRSNWLQRPLSDSQYHYAVEDVVWLPALHEHLLDRLRQKQRDGWCEQECDRFVRDSAQEMDPQRAYLKFKSAWRLRKNQLQMLRALCAWREEEARSTDVPRGRIVQDSVLYELAQSNISTVSGLRAIQGIGSYTLRRHGDSLLSILNERAPDDAATLVSLPDKKSREYRDLLKSMQGVVRETAKSEDLPPEILGRKRDLEEYLTDRENSVIARSWREQLIGSGLDSAIAESNYR